MGEWTQKQQTSLPNFRRYDQETPIFCGGKSQHEIGEKGSIFHDNRYSHVPVKKPRFWGVKSRMPSANRKIVTILTNRRIASPVAYGRLVHRI